jgi:hypothetical protein
MIWLTWRQLRLQATAVYVAVAAAAVVLAVTGPHLADLAQLGGSVFDRLTSTDRTLFYAGIVVVAAAPALVGAFWGAPLVARELESGTHRLVWSQSITRTRWLAVKLGASVLGVAVAVGLLSLAVTWWSQPIDGALSQTTGGLPGRMTPVSFAMRCVVPVGYAVFALVLSVTLGVVVRRALPAMALGLAVFAFVQIAVPLWVRPHLLPPTQATLTITRAGLDAIEADGTGAPSRILLHTGNHGDWILSNQTVNADGQATALPAWLSQCLPAPPAAPVAEPSRSRVQPSDLESCFQRLTEEGYRQRVVYQAADRFWPLQWLETGLYLVVSGLLAGLCFWWTRNRLS